jgi:uncharacterized membrane protein YgcG
MIVPVKQTLLGAVILTLCGLPAIAQDAGPFATQDPLARELGRSSVFVGKTLRDQVDSSALEAIAQQAPPDRPLKIALLSQLPADGRVYGTRQGYTKALHDYLGLGRGALLIVTKRGSAMATDALSAAQIDAILQRNDRTLQSNPVQGVRDTVADLDASISGGPVPAAGPNGAPAPQPDQGFPGWMIGVPLLVVGGGAALWASQRAAKRREALRQARLPVERLRSDVLGGLTYTDTYLDLLPASDDATTARSERQRAAGLLDQAAGLSRAARAPEDYGRAEALLEQAKEATDKAKACIDRATGGTGMAVALDGTEYKSTPVNPDGTPNLQAAPVLSDLNPEDIPASERAACFFCSRPARLSDLTPVTVAINGQRRKVLACADDVRTVQQGATPAVRTVQVQGRAVPWYSAGAYDPYRDYRYTAGYDPYYGYGYGSGMIDGLFLGAMLSQPMPVAYPVFMDNQGYATADPGQAMMPDTTPEIQNAGSADFFGTDGSDFATGADTADFGSGASDFGGSDSSASDFSAGPDSADFGGNDSGGWDAGGDSGGWDSGGSDSGGDFGGGDSGGGGDF